MGTFTLKTRRAIFVLPWNERKNKSKTSNNKNLFALLNRTSQALFWFGEHVTYSQLKKVCWKVT